MIFTEEYFDCSVDYPLTRLGNPEKLLFFDIETTGLSAHSSSLYLIGCVSYDGSRWKLVQWMAERFLEEVEVLQSFLQYCHDYDTLVHFNGDTFDIPYLTACGRQYGIEVSLDTMESIDLLRLIRPLKKLLCLDNLRLKTIERFLGIYREDQYTGGELIKVYEYFASHPSEEAKHLLLLHNAEDLKNLPPLLSILNYTSLSEHAAAVLSCSVSEDTLTIQCQADCRFPVTVTITQSHFSCILHEDRMTFSVPLYSGQLCHFYADYRNYFYLPAEGYAVHKKVGQFVDPGHRVKATKETAFGRTDGTFLPLAQVKRPPNELVLGEETVPVLRESFESRDCFIPFRPEQTLLLNYAVYLLKAK